jgi:hypothetical protein
MTSPVCTNLNPDGTRRYIRAALKAGATREEIAGSVPTFGAGGFAGLVTVAAIMFIMLIPYFAFRDIGRALGPGELRKLLFSRPTATGTAP